MLQLITTGGTLAYAPRDGRLHLTGDEMLGRLTASGMALDDIASRDLADLPSPSVTTAHMLEIVHATRAALVDPTVDGVVITHGTATMEETAYLLDITVQTSKPVIVTGSMRRPDAVGYDGGRNLADALLAARSPEAASMGVLVVFNGEIHAARHVTKAHANALNAFHSEFGPLGRVAADGPQFVQRVSQAPVIDPGPTLPRVDLLKLYAGITGDVVAAIAGLPTAGLVLETMGGGLVPPAILPAIDAAVARIPVVATTRCPEGRVVGIRRRVEDVQPGYGPDLARRGVMFAPVSGLKARLRLMALLGSGAGIDGIRARISE